MGLHSRERQNAVSGTDTDASTHVQYAKRLPGPRHWNIIVAEDSLGPHAPNRAPPALRVKYFQKDPTLLQ